MVRVDIKRKTINKESAHICPFLSSKIVHCAITSNQRSGCVDNYSNPLLFIYFGMASYSLVYQ